MNKYGDLLKKIDFFLKLATSDKGESGSKFSVEKLKKICHNYYTLYINKIIGYKLAKHMISYANKFLPELGYGKARIVYKLTPASVLKIAKNDFGLIQNKTELDIFTNPETAPMVTKIFDYDTHDNWIIAEYVIPLKSEEEFKELTGMVFSSFYDAISFSLDEYDSYSKGPYIKTNIDNHELVLNTIKTVKATGLIWSELEYIGHWGKTADGRIVVLDYGFREDDQIH